MPDSAWSPISTTPSTFPVIGAGAAGCRVAREAHDRGAHVILAASVREESRGPHCRSDFPVRDDLRFGRPILIWSQDGRLQYRFEIMKP